MKSFWNSLFFYENHWNGVLSGYFDIQEEDVAIYKNGLVDDTTTR